MGWPRPDRSEAERLLLQVWECFLYGTWEEYEEAERLYDEYMESAA